MTGGGKTRVAKAYHIAVGEYLATLETRSLPTEGGVGVRKKTRKAVGDCHQICLWRRKAESSAAEERTRQALEGSCWRLRQIKRATSKIPNTVEKLVFEEIGGFGIDVFQKMVFLGQFCTKTRETFAAFASQICLFC